LKITILCDKIAQIFTEEFNRYFPEYDGFKMKCLCSMIRNLFIVKVDIHEDIIKLQNGRKCKVTFESGLNIIKY